MKIEVSIAEIIDKLSILEIKKNNIIQADRLKNVINEYDYLYNIVFEDLKISKEDYKSLLEINKKLWDIEDHIRICEKKSKFDYEFIQLARNVYITNDLRSNIKKTLNIKYNSTFIEEKSYE